MSLTENKTAYCIEYFYAKPQFRQQLSDALLKIAKQTQKEPGCLQYDLLEDDKNENLLIIVLKFTNKEAILAHEKAPYVTSFVETQMNQYCEKVIWNDASLVHHSTHS